MKSLLKYLSPFAPDLAGAVSVLFELDGVIVICDAGGCTGNICGFDEPRWFTRKSALFSAALRDMDAILGRDRQLADKLIAALQKNDLEEAAQYIGNSLAFAAFDKFPLLRIIREEMQHSGALKVELSGSGPTIFALYPTMDAALQAKIVLSKKLPGIRIVGGPDQSKDC